MLIRLTFAWQNDGHGEFMGNELQNDPLLHAMEITHVILLLFKHMGY